MAIDFIGDNKECEIKMNKLAREQMKLKLLKDIRLNFIICDFTGENPKDYLHELKAIIDEFLKEE